MRILALACLLAVSQGAAASEALWTLLKAGGQVVLMRHAVTTPGVGDPAGMRLEDCSTQRNLTDAGRRHAERIGDAFRARRIPVSEVQSSPWCRCIETARLAFGGAPRIDASLGNLFGRPEQREPQLVAMKKDLLGAPRGGNRILVSHGSTIQALTGISPGTGEMVVVTPHGGGRFALAGRLEVE
jgi:broad specificity phosphatase PhoE